MRGERCATRQDGQNLAVIRFIDNRQQSSGHFYLARVLALHLTYYRGKYRAIPDEKSYELLRRETLTDEEVDDIADGFEVLVKVMQILGSPEGCTRIDVPPL